MKIKDWSNKLIFATFLVMVVRYIGAFASSDVGRITGGFSEAMTFFTALSGFGMGVLDVLGGGLLFNGWRITMPHAGQRWTFRFKILTFCVFGLVTSGLVILVPFTVSRMTQSSIVETLGGATSLWTYVWATMVNVVPYLLIGGVFVGNKMVESLESEPPKNGNLPENEKVTRNLPVNWRLVRPTLDDKQLEFLANAEPRQIVAKLRESGVNISPRTASNWHYNARRELGMLVENE